MTRAAAHQLPIVEPRKVGALTWAIVTECKCGHPLTAVSHSRQSALQIIRRKMADHRRGPR